MQYRVIATDLLVPHNELQSVFPNISFAPTLGTDILAALGLEKFPLDNATLLAQAKALKNAEINSARLSANYTTFTHGGKTISCDALSRSDIDGANGYISLYGALPGGWPGAWKAVDNTYVVIADIAAWKAFYTSLFAQGNANFTHAQTLKAALASATSVAQVEAISW